MVARRHAHCFRERTRRPAAATATSSTPCTATSSTASSSSSSTSTAASTSTSTTAATAASTSTPAASASASAASASASAPLPRPAGPGTAPWGREAADPGSALLGWPCAPRSLEALTARSRRQPGAEAGHDQAQELSGQDRGRPAIDAVRLFSKPRARNRLFRI